MSNIILFESGDVKVTNEFLQIGDESCQISDIDYPFHEVTRDWKGAFINAGMLIAIIWVSVDFVTSIWAYVISFLFMAVCIFNLWHFYKGDNHWLGVVKKTGGKNMVTHRGTAEAIDEIIAAIIEVVKLEINEENHEQQRRNW